MSKDPELTQESVELSRTSAAKTLAVLLVAVLGLQMLLRQFESEQRPGPSRGDIAFERSDLPDAIGNWSLTSFSPGSLPEYLPQEQYWWTHSWKYECGECQAIVAIDQANFTKWHDLTICYRGSGWTLQDCYAVPVDSGHDQWSFTQADFSVDDCRSAFLTFSQFSNIGMPVTSMADRSKDDKSGSQSWLERIITRGCDEAAEHSSVIQCQAVATVSGEITASVKSDLVELHLATRELLRQLWLNRSSSSSLSTSINSRSAP